MVNLNDPRDAYEVTNTEEKVSAPHPKLLWPLRLFIAIAVIAGVVGTISYADQILQPDKPIEKPIPQKSFVAVGIVKEISATSLTLNPAIGPDKKEGVFTIQLGKVRKIETKTYDRLTISDVQVGDKIIVQGTQSEDGEISANRIISFATRFPDKPGSMRVA